MDPILLDVNVHPTKQEVRLSKEAELIRLIKEVIAERLSNYTYIPQGMNNVLTKKEKAKIEKINFLDELDNKFGDVEDKNIFSEETGTCVSFSEFSKDRLGSKESINSTRIKENILSEFLPAFHKMKEAGKNIRIIITLIILIIILKIRF